MIQLTENAIKELLRLLDGDVAFLRIGVKGGGCSGMQYDLSFVPAVGSEKVIFDKSNIRVIADAKSSLYLEGLTLDFQSGLTGQGFTFNNPNAKRTCGCGSSFSC